MSLTKIVEDFIQDLHEQQFEDTRVGETPNYTDQNGVTHIIVGDTNKQYELVDGQWVEKMPF